MLQDSGLTSGKPDPAFVLVSQKNLRLGGECETQDAWRYLSTLLVRNPLGLRRHVQRIYLLIDSDNPELLFGALVDLNLVLKDKGLDLRTTLLERAKVHLGDDQYQYLYQHLDKGLSKEQVLPVTAGSLYDRALVGLQDIVGRAKQEIDNGELDALTEAASLLEYGQLDEARRLLENALLETPEDGMIEAELLAIYRATRNKEAFEQMRKRLQDNGLTLSPEWEQL